MMQAAGQVSSRSGYQSPAYDRDGTRLYERPVGTQPLEIDKVSPPACKLSPQNGLYFAQGYSALYLRLPRLLAELDIFRGDGRYAKLLASLAKTDVLILDDWGLGDITATNRRDLLEVIEERHHRRSTIATSQLPVDKWHG